MENDAPQSFVERVCAVILAAGKGTRMNEGNPSPKPKVLYEANGHPLISFSVDAVKRSGIKNIVVVIGYMGEQVQEYLGEGFHYAWQHEPLGTGHAVKSALDSVPPQCDTIVVIYGDDFYDAEDLRKLIEKHFEEENVITVMTAQLENPGGFGRIKRIDGQIRGIVEQKLATEEEKLLDEVNTGMYVFNLAWVKEAIQKVQKNETGEYFLTDLVQIAATEGKKIHSYQMQNTGHWLGINSPEQLLQASKKLLTN